MHLASCIQKNFYHLIITTMHSRTKRSASRSRKNLGMIKYLLVAFLGISGIFLITQAFDITTSLSNAVQYVRQIILTVDGSSNSPAKIILDGTTGGGITLTDLTGKVVLGTDTTGMIIASSSGDVFNYISGDINNLIS